MSAAASLLPPALLGLSTDYYVLQHFYELMDGANWKNNENWLDGEPCYNEWASSSQYDCYTGDLVRTPQPICCEASVDEARAVVKLDLYGNNLAGTIPEEMANLDQLRLLVLDGNGISGTIPKSLGKMRYLEVLWLQDNSLSGTIPTTLKTYITGDPGSIILRPNRFNCSELDAIENAWCNSSLADLFDAGVTPDGLSSGRDNDKGCIDDTTVDGDVDYSDAGQVIEDVDEGTIASIVEGSDKTVLYIVVIVMTGVGIVMLYEILSRLAKARARRSGRLTEEQKERDQQRVQAERMNQLREVQLQRMEADREADEEIEAEEQIKRLSAGGKDRRRKKRQSICGVSRSRPRASSVRLSTLMSR